ncbi:hypothetical protein A2899_00730 [Candidatus Amesbacteria bacterium RIFCSPLOWO2_01_FULL_49_25]|uniref:Cation-transporting P-type ATPase N-terminal domain-containing protein n=1 Tax=Candidatus Amesbacteria bacterium RIFCSPHIGHO2_01_FULL_48_32b TaxID=1797253 RepID=A0A1F4YCT3_9BACT|nr:MAG: hypothetical protein A2876_01515 [Candidatus Amesbacteria bacterium RIFCSPHIGHO2_01_FULL_48_32b]OGD08032.1 MAG: hypothetical protein A2899_00730 [Candidatus Amesbacteria bacterium RIFCSPLOWO2_01_FULL_49_25]
MYPDEPGLTTEEAKRLLGQHGPNLLPEKPPPTPLSIYLSQFKNPLVYVLTIAGFITLLLQHFPDSTLIFLAVFLNSLLGFIQEKKANDALSALKRFISPKTEVIRDGIRQKIDSANLVPGDIVFLSQGTKVPADGQLLFANRVYFDEAIITGESVPVAKQRSDAVFMGSTVSSGLALIKVTATGQRTKIGGIANQIQQVREDTPLRLQLNRFSKKLVSVILFLTSFILIIGSIRGEKLIDMFKIAVALAVSSIPEGLIVSMTVILAIGMQRILRRRGLVRKLASAETLGGVTTICVDKTGTLTEGKMQVVKYIGDQIKLAQQIVLANDLDDPLLITGFEWGRATVKDFLQEHPRLDSIPFSPQDRFFTSLHKWDSRHHIIFVNGAPEVLLDWCNIDDKTKVGVKKDLEDLTSQGLRVLGLARKVTSLKKVQLTASDAQHDLTWVGLIVFTDPVRHGVKEALQIALQAGIKLIVITGDYPKTAKYVLSEINMPISDAQILLGSQLERLTVSQLAQKVRSVKLFARTTPEQKLKIVEALKKNGEVVAMMGDGVNDAPALHKSDIGIVVDQASDVAKETADLVLLDSNFSTVIAAIEEGRGIFDNIRKIILYLLSDAFGEIVVVVGSIILGLPLPITAVQILWINLISDGFPFFALTIDPKRADIMRKPPRNPQEPLITGWMSGLVGTVSFISGISALLFFIYMYKTSGDILLARSITFITLGTNSLVYVFSTRTLLTPFWKNHLFENRWLVLAVIAGFGLQITPFILPGSREFFGVTNPGIVYWLIAISLSTTLFFVVEGFKFLHSSTPR